MKTEVTKDLELFRELRLLRDQRDAMLAALKDVYRHPHNLTTTTLTMVGAAIKLAESDHA